MAKKRQAEAAPVVETEVVAPVVRMNEGLPAANAISEDIREELVRRVFDGGESIVSVAREMGLNRNTIMAWLADLKEEREAKVELENIRLADLLEVAGKECVNAINKAKLAKAGVKDLAIAAGILLDKRRDLLGPRKGSAISRLRIAWKDGSGAVEVETGGD